MNYEGQICRAPMERSAFIASRVMVGCSYNGCKFCNLFRPFKVQKAACGTDRNQSCRE